MRRFVTVSLFLAGLALVYPEAPAAEAVPAHALKVAIDPVRHRLSVSDQMRLPAGDRKSVV